MNENLFPAVIVLTLFLALVGLGIHQAIDRLLSLVDGHLERLQGKLDILLAMQTEHNEKMDVILRKLF